MNFISHCLSASQQVFSSLKEDFRSLSNRDKRIVTIASIAFGLVALATRRVMIAVPIIVLGFSAAYYIFKHHFHKKIDLRPQILVAEPRDLRPTITPQTIDLRHLTRDLTAEDLPMYASVKLTIEQVSSLRIKLGINRETGISEHDHFRDSNFLVSHTSFRRYNDNTGKMEDLVDWTITRFLPIQERDLPQFIPVYLCDEQISSLGIDREGVSEHDRFRDSYFVHTMLLDENGLYNKWRVVRVPRLQEKDFPKFTSVTLNNDQYLSLKIDSNGKSSRACFASFKFNCKQLPNGDWIVSR